MKQKKLILMILVAFLLLTFLNPSMAKQGDTVAVDYWLTADDKQIDTSEGRGLFEFTLGKGQVIPGFDKAVEGMKVGEEKTVVLTGNDAYTQGPLAGKDLTFRIILREIK
jgi:peptidylprolyl isomerase